MIRFLIKLALFPVTLILTLLVAFARFFCLFSGMVLNVIAGALFLFGVLMLFIGEWHGFLGFAVLAWAISPYGLPGAVVWLTERVVRVVIQHFLKTIVVQFVFEAVG